MAAQKPRRIVITSYQVGFGDCYLLTFEYPRRKRYVLIDFGTKFRSRVKFKADLRGIAAEIKKTCGGALDIVIATHRHYDHISGFAQNKRGDGPGDVIRACRPKLVVQPWTERPDLPADAREPEPERRHVASLKAMNDLADALTAAAPPGAARGATGVTAELAYLGSDNITNKSAVENLMTMAGRPRRNYLYVKRGDKLPVAGVLPGVTVHVLGPPTIAQAPDIANYAQTSDEYWNLQAAALAPAVRDVARWPGPDKGTRRVPQPAQWFVRQLRRMHDDARLEIVRSLDKAINNTSLILVFEAGGKRLLFPGDAQLENWTAAVADKKNRALLASVDLYKVGHHGSGNATPRHEVWDAFKKRGPKFRTLLSTHAGEYSGVPRASLHKALTGESTLLTTEDYKKDEDLRTVTIDL